VVRAKKHFGQHFLEPVWAAKVLRAIAPAPGDAFLEIGPGGGALTRPLVAATGRVLAIEIDSDLAGRLREERIPGLTVVERDFLALSARELTDAFVEAGLAPPVRVAGNLPYNVAAPILFALRTLHAQGVGLGDATVMLQREVADRLTAVPGSKEYGVLTVLIGYAAICRRVLDLPPGAFRPVPKVRSSVVRLEFRPPQPVATDEVGFERLVKALFSRRRKTLLNGVQAGGTSREQAAALLEQVGVDARRRPETLSIPEFVGLANAWDAML